MSGKALLSREREDAGGRGQVLVSQIEQTNYTRTKRGEGIGLNVFIFKRRQSDISAADFPFFASPFRGDSRLNVSAAMSLIARQLLLRLAALSESSSFSSPNNTTVRRFRSSKTRTGVRGTNTSPSIPGAWPRLGTKLPLDLPGVDSVEEGFSSRL